MICLRDFAAKHINDLVSSSYVKLSASDFRPQIIAIVFATVSEVLCFAKKLIRLATIRGRVWLSKGIEPTPTEKGRCNPPDPEPTPDPEGAPCASPFVLGAFDALRGAGPEEPDGPMSIATLTLGAPSALSPTAVPPATDPKAS
jgi:hypothetical protein